jgi:hypothetical protein
MPQYVSFTIFAVFLLGWIIPLTIGIAHLRRSHSAAGVVLTVIGGLWGVPALAGLIMGSIFYLNFSKTREVHTFDATHSPHATITIPWQGQGTLEYTYGGKRYVATSENGQFAVPAGRIILSSFTACSPDKQGWSGRSTLLDKSSTLTLTAGQQQALVAGPPYAAQVKVTRSADKATLVMDLKDAGGHSASVSDPGRKTPPGFEVRDPAGKVVWQGKFAYG